MLNIKVIKTVDLIHRKPITEDSMDIVSCPGQETISMTDVTNMM